MDFPTDFGWKVSGDYLFDGTIEHNNWWISQILNAFSNVNGTLDFLIRQIATEVTTSVGYVDIGPGPPGTIGNFRLIVVGGKLEIQECTGAGWSSYAYHAKFP